MDKGLDVEAFILDNTLQLKREPPTPGIGTPASASTTPSKSTPSDAAISTTTSSDSLMIKTEPFNAEMELVCIEIRKYRVYLFIDTQASSDLATGSVNMEGAV